MSVCVVMPAWNESEGIAGFLAELDLALSPWEPHFVVVDDCSTDVTRETVETAAANGLKVTVVTNQVNRGHGPSTMRALGMGLESGADIVVALDGDGQFLGGDVAAVVRELTAGNWDVVEGVRTSRSGPAYRRVVTTGTRLLVWTRSHALPQDANTPLRAYRSATLASLLDVVPREAMTPNLIISVLCRRWAIRCAEVQVESRPRRGASEIGSTWGRGAVLPSARFLRFCRAAAIEWIRTPTNRGP